MIAPSFYRGKLSHRRSAPAHRFERDILMAFVDVEAVDAAPKGVLRLAPRWPVTIRAGDHLSGGRSGGPGDERAVSLTERVRRLVDPVLGEARGGPMGLLTQPRMCGITFNPVSFVYCFDRAGERVEAIVAEVTNTPWGERYAYVLAGGEAGADGLRRFDAEKRLHVSPFFGMDHHYRFRFSDPGESTRLSIENRRAGQVVFQASLSLDRISEHGRLPIGALVRHPVMPAETMVGIYLQALRLALKRTPFHAHPRKRAPDDDSGTRSPAVPLRGTK